MALINCPECAREISDLCKTCPQCGYPIQQCFRVNFYIPQYRSDKFIEDLKFVFLKDNVRITSEDGSRLFVDGKTDWSYSFHIKKPQVINILYHKSYTVTGMIYPGKNYTLAYKIDKQGNPEFYIAEESAGSGKRTVGSRQQ